MKKIQVLKPPAHLPILILLGLSLQFLSACQAKEEWQDSCAVEGCAFTSCPYTFENQYFQYTNILTAALEACRDCDSLGYSDYGIMQDWQEIHPLIDSAYYQSRREFLDSVFHLFRPDVQFRNSTSFMVKFDMANYCSGRVDTLFGVFSSTTHTTNAGNAGAHGVIYIGDFSLFRFYQMEGGQIIYPYSETGW